MDNTFARGKDVLLMMLMVFAVLVVVSKWLMVVGWFMVVVAIHLTAMSEVIISGGLSGFFQPNPYTNFTCFSITCTVNIWSANYTSSQSSSITIHSTQLPYWVY